MKLQYKLLLMLILFFGIVVFYNQKSFAFTNDDCKKFYDSFSKPIESTSDILSSGLPYIDQISTSDIKYSNTETTEGNFLYCTYTKDNCTHYLLLYMKYQGLYYLDSITYSPQSLIYYLCKINNRYATLDNFVLGIVDIKIDNSGNISKSLYYPGNFAGFSVSSENFKVLYTTSDFTILNENGQLSFFQPSGFVEPDVDKLNLYELNLTDLDYNNAVHKFNLATYTNSVCYSEIMEYYNKDYPYAIFVTDYTRILTYDSESSMNLQQGAYLLSGYIDFLIDDKAFFYYSNYRNRFMSRSGSLLDVDPSAYKVRFSFKAVYSEDTSDPYYIDWTVSNGDLLYTTLLDDFDYAYFVGSNYTIYYAEEKNNGKFKKLTNDVRKLGYLNKKEGGNVLDVSLMDERFYFIHNFNFSGGVTHKQYLNVPTYEKDRLDLIGQIYNDYGISDVKQDGSNGNSYTSSDDIRDSQFEQGDVTDSTTNEEAKDHTGNSFGALNNKDLDDSNWGILDYLSYWFNQDKNGSDKASSTINQATDTITNKFSFKDNMINNANEIKDFISSTQATHKYYLNINHKYLSGNICIIDLSWYEPYKPTVDAFICAFAYLAFMWHMFCNIPSLIRGSSAGSYVSDISTYTHTGFGRSSSIHKGGV